MNRTRKKHFRRYVAVIYNAEGIVRQAEMWVYVLLRYSRATWIFAPLSRAHISFTHLTNAKQRVVPPHADSQLQSNLPHCDYTDVLYNTHGITTL